MQETTLTTLLKKKAGEFARVVPFSPGADALLALDFTANNKDLTPLIVQDTVLLTRYINEKLQQAGARYGIGGYAEHRAVYSRSALFGPMDENEPSSQAGETGTEQRRLHLGIDIWGRPHTAVMPPLNGIVNSFANNDAFGDYGATIILTHQLDGVSFYTLYGHLSLNSLKNLQEGQLILKGDVFAEFGIPLENGQWPPHLHFQIMADLQGWKGDYPGVCKFSERDKWLGNCPDPDLVLQMNQYLRR